MPHATERELDAARKVAEAVTEFLIAWDEGRRLRTPEQAKPQVEVKLPEWPPAPALKPELPKEPKLPPADPGQLIGVQELAKLLGCAPRTIYRLADGGRMPRPRKLGGLVRWSLAEIRKWVEDGCPKDYRRR